MGAVYRGQGRQLGGRAIQSAIGGDTLVVGGGARRRGGAGRAGVGRSVKNANYKRWGWDPSSDVWMLFEGDPARPCHPLHVETENKLGDCVLKIRCCICRSLISHHNSSWSYAATHIQSHNIATAQDIVAAAALASESEANGEAFPIRKLPTPPPVKKEAAGGTALMRRTFAAPSYETDTQPYPPDQANNCKVDSSGLPSIQDSGDRCVQGNDEELGPKVPRLRQEGHYLQVGHCHEYCSILPAFINNFSYHCSSISMHSKVEVVACRT